MIEFFVGTPGSGKSYHAAKEIATALRRGRYVVTNMYFNTDSEKYVYTVDIDINVVLKYPGALVVLDECQNVLGCREWNDKTRPTWLRFFTLHRHAGYDCILVTQQIEMIDKQIRGLSEYYTMHVSIRRIKLFRWFCILTRSNLMYYKTFNMPTKIKLTGGFLLGRKKIYNLYDTKEIVSGHGFEKYVLLGL